MSVITPSRRESLRRLAWRLDTPAGSSRCSRSRSLLRLLIAPHRGLLRRPAAVPEWTARLADVGTHKFYDPSQFADYPPGYLYVLWLTARSPRRPGYLLLKLPAILADLALAWIAGTFAARTRAGVDAGAAGRSARSSPRRCSSTPPSSRSARAGDRWTSVPAVFVLCVAAAALHRAGIRCGATSPPSSSSRVAVAMKPQSGFVLPVMLYALYRRYLHRAAASGADRRRAQHRRRSACSSLGLWAVSGLAFGLGPVVARPLLPALGLRLSRSRARTRSTSGASIGFWRNDSTGDHVMTIAGISALHLGMLAVRRRRRRRAVARAPRDRARRRRGARARPSPRRSSACSRTRC